MSEAHGNDIAAAMPQAARSLAEGAGDAALRCEFEHPFFAWIQGHGGGRFRFDEVSGGGAFHVQISEEMHFTLPIGPLARELGLHESDSPDAARLRMAGEAVNYVETLELGAELPAEVTTGQASWPLPERYLAAALLELTQRIAALATQHQENGQPVPAGLQEVLIALGHTPPPQAGAAESAASEKRRLEAEGLAAALASIDCLRDRSVAALSVLSAGAGAAMNLLPARSEACNAAAGLQRVVEMAGRRMARELESASREPPDIVAALADPEPTRARLAVWRNRLYAEVRRLEAAMRPWQGVMLAADAATKQLVFNTYRLMGRRDLPAESWSELEAKLASALLPPGTDYRNSGPKMSGAKGHRMIWNNQSTSRRG